DPGSAASGSSPWSGAGGELSRQAGLDDVGRASSSGDDSSNRGHGLLDDGRSEDIQDDQDADDLDDDFGFDDGGVGSDPCAHARADRVKRSKRPPSPAAFDRTNA